MNCDPIIELNKFGNVYLIGGIVRDKLYNLYHNKNKKSKDYDIIVTNIELEKVLSILEKFGKTKQVGKHFGVIKFNYQEMEFDIALPRKEKSTGISYKDFDIECNETIPLIEDVFRRDATINSIALSVSSMKDLFCNDKDFLEKNIVDYVGGVNDIKNKYWKGIKPDERFAEDPTRMMRAIRQCSQLDFEIYPETRDAIIKNKHLIQNILDVSCSRITNEFVKILSSNNSKKWIDFIFESKISDILELSYYDLTNFENHDYRIKLPFLIKNELEWIKKYNLYSCESFSTKYTNFIIHSQRICNCISPNDVSVRMAISNINSFDKTRDNNYDKYLFDMYYVVNGYSDEINEIYERNKYLTPIDINDVRIDGKMLMDKYRIFGKDIKTIKEKIFDMIINLKLENNEESIEKYLVTKLYHGII
jgi:tRNA nucleotidyltransferase/poly(A) polymerase